LNSFELANPQLKEAWAAQWNESNHILGKIVCDAKAPETMIRVTNLITKVPISTKSMCGAAHWQTTILGDLREFHSLSHRKEQSVNGRADSPVRSCFSIG